MPPFNFSIPIPKRSFFDDLTQDASLPDIWKAPQLELGPLPEQEQIVEPEAKVTSGVGPVYTPGDIQSAIKGYKLTKVFAPKSRNLQSAIRDQISTPPEATTGQAPASVLTESEIDAAGRIANEAINSQGGLADKLSGFRARANKFQTEKAIAQGGNVVQSKNLETQKVPVRFSVNTPAGTNATLDQVRRSVLQGAGMNPDVVGQIEEAIGAPLLNWTPEEARQIEATVNFHRKPVTKTGAEAAAYGKGQLYRYSSEAGVPRSAFAIYDAFLRGGPSAARQAYGLISLNVQNQPEARPVTDEERAAAVEAYRPPSFKPFEMANRFAATALETGLSAPEGAAELVDALSPGDPWLGAKVRPFTDTMKGFVERTMPVDPKDKGWSALIPSAVGSTVPFLAGGVTGAPRAASAILGAATNAQQVAREFDASKGAQAYPGQFKGNRRGAVLGAGAIGTLEAFGIEGRMGQFGTRSRLMDAVEQGIIGEGGQEAFTDLMNDLNAVYGGKYDKKRSIGQGMLESFALGAVVGTGFEGTSFLASRLADRRERLAYAAGVAQSQPDSPLGQIVNQAGITLETINQADDRAVDELTKRLEVWARAESQIKQLQARREQLAAQSQGAEARLRTGRVPTGPELQIADQVAQLDERIAEATAVQDETAVDLEEKVSPLFRRLRDAGQQEQEAASTDVQAPSIEAEALSIGAEAPSIAPTAVIPPAGQQQSPLFRRIAEAVAASQPTVETLADVEEERPDLLKEVRREGGMTGDVEAGELRRLGLKEGGTTGLAQRSGLSPDEMRARMVSEGLSQAETAPDFIQQVEDELRFQKQRNERAELAYEDYLRSQLSESEREQSDRLDELLTQPENPFTQAFRRIDNPKIPLTDELIEDFTREAEREEFDDDFINGWISTARGSRGAADAAPVGTAPAPAQEQSLSQLEQVLDEIDRRIDDKRRQGEETSDDWGERRRIESQIEQITGKKFREYRRQAVPQEPAPPVRQNIVPEWMRNRNVYRMGGDEITKLVNDLRTEKARQEAAGPDNVDRGLWMTTRIMLKAAEERRAELKKGKTETVPPLNEPLKPQTPEARAASQKRATVAREQVEAAIGPAGQTLTSERAAAELEAGQRLKESSKGRTVTVGDKQYALTPEQEARWKTEVDEPLKQVEIRAADKAKHHGRAQAEKYRKGEAMRIAAVKRQIVGALTPKEQTAKEKRDTSNFTGKKVLVDGRNATVIGTPFGKVKVRFDEGGERIVPRDQVGEPAQAKQTEASVKQKEGEEPRTVVHPNPEIDRKPVLAETQDGRVIVPNPANKGGVSVVKDRSDEPAEHKFSSTQVALPKEVADKILAFGRQIPDKDLAEDGRENEPHITLKYGLHGADSKFVEEALAGEEPITVKFGKVSLFSNNEFDVVKVDVESPDLHRLNQKVSEAQPVTDTFPTYQPHVTIAYLKKGKGAKYVGNSFLEGQTARISSVTFSGRDGERVEIPLEGKVEASKPKAAEQPVFDRISPEARRQAEEFAARWTDVANDQTTFRELVENSRVRYRRDPGNQRAGIIYTDSHGHRLYMLMLSEYTNRDERFLAIAVPGSNLAAHREMVRYFMDVSHNVPAAELALSQFESALTHAILDRVDGVVFFNVHMPAEQWERAAPHESFHVWQYGAPDTSEGWVERQPGYDKMRDELLARGYRDRPVDIAREWAAYAVTNDVERFGFTEEEGLQFLEAYFDEIVAQGGAEALDRIGVVAPKPREIIESKRRKHGRSDSRSQTTERPEEEGREPGSQTGPTTDKIAAGRSPAGSRIGLQGRTGGGREDGSRTPDAREASRDQRARSAAVAAGGDFASLPVRGSVSARDVGSPADHFYHSQIITKERGKRGALVYMNDHAKLILASALDEATGRKHYHATALEVARENLQKAVAALESEASANNRYKAEILRTVEEWERILDEHPTQKSFTFHDVTEFAARREAAIPSDREKIVREFKRTSRHERFHWSQRQIVGGQGLTPVGASWAQSTKGWGKYRRQMLSRGYPDNPEILAAELAAHIAAEDYDRLELKTEAEIAAAEDWLAKYFERVADRYGIEALDQFGSLLKHASRAREKAGTDVRTRQAEQSVRGTEAAAAGAGATGNGPPPPGGGGRGVQGGAPGGKRRPDGGSQGVRQEAAVQATLPSETGSKEITGQQRGLSDIKSPAFSPDDSINSGPMPTRQPGLGDVKSPARSAAEQWEAGQMPEEQQALIDTKKKRDAAGFLRTVGDLWHLPKSLMSSGDISAAGRQGLFLSLPPTRWHLAMRAFGRQILSFKKANYDKFVKMLRVDKAYRDAKAAGLYLSTDEAKGGPLSDREENFVSELAQEIPHVRWTEQAYKTYLDSIRLDTFKKYKKVIDKQFRDPGERFEAYQAAAEWINTSSGRGKFHGRFGQAFDNSVPFLNVFFYAPRYAVSRIQMLNPLTYARNLKSPQHRVVFRHQMSELFQSAAMLATTAALARAAGFSVSFDDEDPDFLNIRWGSTRYDVLGGLKQVVRLAFGISRWAASELTEDDEKALAASRREQGKDALKYLRGKLSPLMGFVADWLNDWTAITGERHAPGDFMTSFGEGEYAKMADDIANDPVISQALPMMAADLVSAWYNGYRNTGDSIGSVGRAAKILPAGLGVGVADYDRPEYSQPIRKALRQYGIEPRYPKKKEYETDKEFEARIPEVIQDQSVIVQEFQNDDALKGFPKEIQREVLSDALSENGRERMKQLKPEWLHKDWQTRAIIEEWKRDMEQNPVFKQMSGAAKEAAMHSFMNQMSKFKAQGGKKPKPPRPFTSETVRRIIAKSLNQ